MIKRSLILTSVIILCAAIMLALTGLSFSDQKTEQKKKEDRKNDPSITKEIKIISLREEIPLTDKFRTDETDNKKKKPPETKKTDSDTKHKPKMPNQKKAIVPEQLQEPKDNHIKRKLIPASFRLKKNLIETGKVLIDDKLPIPIVHASYDQIGFGKYLRKMIEMGGNLFVGDTIRGKILAKALVFDNGRGDFHFNGIDGGNMSGSLADKALFRPREISGEKLINDILSYSKSKFRGDLRCVVLLPIETEAAILGSLKEYLRNGSYDISTFDLVWGHYFDSNNEFGLKLEKARVLKTGEIIELNMKLVI